MDDIPTFGELPAEEPRADIFDTFDDEDASDDGEGEPVTAGRPPVPAVRHESLQQRENFASTGRFTLRDGPKVRVTGRTLLIHGKTKESRVKLQLAKERRTKYVFPAWETADGRISLEGDEVENLYARLTEARQNLGEKAATDYFVVNTANPNIENLETLLRAVATNPAQFVPLTTMVGAEQLAALHAVANIGRFRRARHELAKLIAENPHETVFQKWFEANDWVFGTEYIERLTKPRHISADSIIDLMFLAVDGFVDIFELKRPGPDLFVRAPGRGYLIPSPDLNEAFGQAVHYLADADNQGFINEVTRDIPLYRPRVRLVIGRSNEWTHEHRRVYRDTIMAWHRVELLTYDMVLTRIDLLIKTMSEELLAKTGTPVAPPEEVAPGPYDAFVPNDAPAPDDLDDLPF
jgi:hypothetical protein